MLYVSLNRLRNKYCAPAYKDADSPETVPWPQEMESTGPLDWNAGLPLD